MCSAWQHLMISWSWIFVSEVLVLGTYSEGGVVLITPDKKVQNGDKLG